MCGPAGTSLSPPSPLHTPEAVLPKYSAGGCGVGVRWGSQAGPHRHPPLLGKAHWHPGQGQGRHLVCQGLRGPRVVGGIDPEGNIKCLAVKIKHP